MTDEEHDELLNLIELLQRAVLGFMESVSSDWKKRHPAYWDTAVWAIKKSDEYLEKLEG